ncbi:BppU family phage baseplate upper protein [Furfurilactobacillus curtus]|uniref:BppU N-terminal domain-containing protein n=1 Tax=Furfurilactobacillus curtus TaxID=1746200 RepID=A0ABQ5JQH3_9LACO
MSDNQGRTLMDTVWSGQYETVNMTLGDGGTAYTIKQFNGRQGDNGRTAMLRLVKQSQTGLIPYNLTGLRPRIKVLDAQGTVKQFGDDYSLVSNQLGLVTITVPGQVYEAAGQVLNAFLDLIDDNGTVISSVPIVFNVDTDDTKLTQTSSQTYLQTVDEIIAQVQAGVTPLKTEMDALQQAISTGQTSIQEVLNDIANKKVALLNGGNNFTGVQHADDFTTGAGSFNAIAALSKGIGTVERFNVDLTGGATGTGAFFQVDLGAAYLVAFYAWAIWPNGTEKLGVYQVANVPTGVIPFHPGDLLINDMGHIGDTIVMFFVPQGDHADRITVHSAGEAQAANAGCDINFSYLVNK